MTTIDRSKLRKVATITLRCEPEDQPYVGNCLASGDDAEDRKAEEWIRDQLASGNEWAWCIAVVTAEWRGIKEIDTLGACSYKSEDDFTAPDPGGYYESMISEAIERLAVHLETIATNVELDGLLVTSKGGKRKRRA